MKILADLLEKEMDRKEFLQHAGIGMMMLMGGGLILKAFGVGGKREVAAGYGADAYGGKKS